MALGPLGQIHVSVTDLDRSVAFYRDVLGIEFLFRVPGQPMAFFSTGDVRLYLGVPESPEFTTRCLLYFRVTDIETERDRLVDAGLTVEAPHVVHRDGVTDLWMAALTDPDDHHLVLMEERSGVRPDKT
jgi:predicted enzyme related to lactoylglutathione lyase